MRPTKKKVAFTHSEASVSRTAVGVGRQRAIVEGQDDFAVLERQRFVVLHRAQAHMLARVHDDRAADPIAPAGHSAAPAASMPIMDASKSDAAMVLRMPPFTPVLDNPRDTPGPKW
jgi:hypothetical protein